MTAFSQFVHGYTIGLVIGLVLSAEVGAVYLIRHIIRTVRVNKAEAYLRAARIIDQEDKWFADGLAGLKAFPVCPKCGTKEGILGTYQEYTDVRYIRCSDRVYHGVEWLEKDKGNLDKDWMAEVRRGIIQYGRNHPL